MAESNASILGTYGRQLSNGKQTVVRTGAGLLCVITLILAIGYRWTPENSILWAGLIDMVVAFVGVAIWQRLQQHLLSERRRLWPNYVKPHLQVFTVLFVAITIVWPGLLAAFSGLNPIGLIACVTMLVALTGSTVVWRHSLLLAAWYAAFFSLLVAADRWPIRDMVDGSRPLLSLAILSAGMAICACAVGSLLRRTEDDSNYQIKSSEPSFLRQDLKLLDLSRRRNGVLSLSRRWRVTSRLNWMFPGLCVVNSLIQWRVVNRSSNTVDHALFFMCFQNAMMLDGICVPHIWLQQWKYREVDILRPVSRDRYFQEIGAAIAVQTLQYWAIFATIIAATAIGLYHISIKQTMVLVLLSLTCQVLIFGSNVWAMRFRTPVVVSVMSMLPFLPLGAVVILGNGFHWSHPPLIVGAAIWTVVVGLFMTGSAHRKWLKTELG